MGNTTNKESKVVRFKRILAYFFGLWFVFLILNQVLFYSSCFRMHCLSAALADTGTVAFLVVFIVGIYSENNKSKI